MEYNYDGDVIMVSKPIHISVGMVCRISESYGYMGIEPGVIRVTGIVELDSYEGTSLPSDIQAWLDAMCPSGIYHITGVYDDDIIEELDRVRSQPWVAYTTKARGEEYHMPLEEFIDHISIA